MIFTGGTLLFSLMISCIRNCIRVHSKVGSVDSESHSSFPTRPDSVLIQQLEEEMLGHLHTDVLWALQVKYSKYFRLFKYFLIASPWLMVTRPRSVSRGSMECVWRAHSLRRRLRSTWTRSWSRLMNESLTSDIWRENLSRFFEYFLRQFTMIADWRTCREYPPESGFILEIF